MPKKRSFSLAALLIASLASLIAGAFLQREHAFMPIHRILQGRPFTVPSPSDTFLRWAFERWSASTPEFPLSNFTFQEMEAKRAAMVARIGELLRRSEYPVDFASQTRRIETVELGKVVREKLKIEVEPGLWIPFYLLIPKEAAGPLPCVLVLHGHSAGKIETAGLVQSYQQGNALALAEAGFVTAAPDLRGFGELGWSGDWDDPDGHNYGRAIHVDHVLASLQTGRTALGSFLYDSQKILDYLETRPEVDPNRIGAVGTSMGADIAIWLALVDSRVKSVVASAIQFFDFPTSPTDFGNYHVCIHVLPGVHNYFRIQEIPLLLAPRPVLFQGIPAIRPRLEALYQQAEAPDRVSFYSNLGQEAFFNQPAIAWLKKWL